VRYFKGRYHDTVPEYFKEYDLDSAEPLFVTFDADDYGTTLFLLTHLWLNVDAYYFIFDEFMQDECVALYDFTRAFPSELEFFAQTTTSTFKQVFGRLKRVKSIPDAPSGAA
jgi:hypothetical protein